MTPDRSSTTTDRRAAYLAAALDLRRMALSAHSPEAREAFMRLVELYQELAEYAAITSSTSPQGPPSTSSRGTPSTSPDGETAATGENCD